MRTLVTGANGFLGAALCRRLSARGDEVNALVRKGAKVQSLEGIPALKLVEGDVTEPGSLASAVEKIDVVFHLAGIRRAAQRADFIRVNADGTTHVCDALQKRGGACRLVLCGSLAAAGPSSPGAPKREEDPLSPREWYGESKAEAERIALSFRNTFEVTVARPPRILGAGDAENLVFFRLVARGWQLVVGGGPRPLTVVDVEDAVTFLLTLAEHQAAVGEVFFLSGPTTTLDELQTMAAAHLGVTPRRLFVPPWALTALATAADGVTQVTGKRLPLNRKLARQLLAPAWTCSGDKAARVLGFRSKKPLEESVRESLDDYRQRRLL